MNKSTAFYMLRIEKTEWHIACYTRKATVGENFLEIFKISNEDKLFIENNIRKNRRELFLLKSEKNSIFLSTHLYFSSGLLFAAVLNDSVEFMSSLADRGKLLGIIKAPSCASLHGMKRLSKEKSLNATQTFESLITLTSGISVIPEVKASYLMILLAEKARLAASLVGSYVEAKNDGVFGTVKNYDISFASAFIIAAVSYVKRAGLTRTGKLSFSSVGEKLYVSFECEVRTNTYAFEFDTLRYCADSLDVGFLVTDDRGKTYARLCAIRPDLSKIGLKNDIFFS